MNQRVAAHMSRKPSLQGPPQKSSEKRPVPVGRAAQAAARVAARYANAPSFNEMLADEARAALRAAQAASRAAQEAHAAAQSVLEGLEAASAGDPPWEADYHDSAPQVQQAGPQSVPSLFSSAPLHEEPLLDAAPADQPVMEAPAGHDDLSPEFGSAHAYFTSIEEMPSGQRYDRAAAGTPPFGTSDLSVAETAQPIYANLIEFPREMIATRKVRPRRVEGPLAETQADAQLSIFEVDPAAISIQPAAPVADEPAAPAWMRPEWSAIELDETPREELPEDPLPAGPPAIAEQLAPLSRRMLAIAVDMSLIGAASLGVAALVAGHVNPMPAPRVAMVAAVLVVLAVAAGYELFFLAITRGTPGMKYAGIELSTFDGSMPTQAQRCKRLAALSLSVLPLGLGLAWALFDDAHLAWHDRFSHTYLRHR